MPGEPLVLGAPRQLALSTVAAQVQERPPERVVIPQVGSFALAVAAVAGGVRPDQVVASDSRLYPSVLGAALAGEDYPLRAHGRWEWLNSHMQTPEGKAAAVAFATSVLRWEGKKPSVFRDERIRELVERADVYLAEAERQVEMLKRKLHGIKFTPDTAVPPVTPTEADMVLVQPPVMPPAAVKLEERLHEAFDFPDRHDTHELPASMLFANANVPMLMIENRPTETGEDPADEMGVEWTSIAADRPRFGKGNTTQFVVSNEAEDRRVVKRTDVQQNVRGPYKLMTEGVIRSTDDLRIVAEKEEVVAYYRDLLVHGLGMVNTERHKVLLLNGKLLGCVGAHLQNLRASGVLNGVVKLTFCFTPTHPDYPRLHRLALLAVTSSWAWADEVKDIELLPRAIQTTMLTPHPEVKTARGIFTLKDRTRTATGYKLTYYADLVDRTPEETLALWLQKWGGK